MDNSKEKEEKIIIIIDGYKFDVTDYASQHPGGVRILKKYNGKDATNGFNESTRGHMDGYVGELMEKMCIGKVE
jgi:cytochrome b involved in lipid metabolism